MPWYHYTELSRDRITPEMQRHYAAESQQVQALGFDDEFYVCETRFPLSVLLDYDVLRRLKRQGILWRSDHLYRLQVYRAFLLHKDGCAYASLWKHRVTFATLFEDGTIVQTCSFRGHFMRGSTPHLRYILQISPTSDMTHTWHLHEAQVMALAETGRALVPLQTMADASRLERRIDEIQTYGTARRWHTPPKAKAKRMQAE